MKSLLAIILSAGVAVQGWTVRVLYDMEHRVTRVEGAIGIAQHHSLSVWGETTVQARTNQ